VECAQVCNRTYHECPSTVTLPPFFGAPDPREMVTQFDFSLILRVYLTFSIHKSTQISLKSDLDQNRVGLFPITSSSASLIHSISVVAQGTYGRTSWVISEPAMVCNGRNTEKLKSKTCKTLIQFAAELNERIRRVPGVEWVEFYANLRLCDVIKILIKSQYRRKV
jgi:hypothetical protein